MESLESQKQASHPFHRPWKSRKDSGLPTFPQLRRLVLIKEGQTRPALRPSLKPSPRRVGQNKLPKWAKISCQNTGMDVWRALEAFLEYRPCRILPSLSASRSSLIGPITLEVKCAGERNAGNPPATFDVAGAGNQLTVRLVRHSQRKRGATDRPNLRSHGASPRPYRGGIRKCVRLEWTISARRGPSPRVIVHATLAYGYSPRSLHASATRPTPNILAARRISTFFEGGSSARH